MKKIDSLFLAFIHVKILSAHPSSKVKFLNGISMTGFSICSLLCAREVYKIKSNLS